MTQQQVVLQIELLRLQVMQAEELSANKSQKLASTSDSTAVIGAPGVGEEIKYFAFEFVSYDSGATVPAEYLNLLQ